MTNRAHLATRFLSGAGWADAERSALAGDASARRYERLHRASGRAVLMDAPPDRGESTECFARMAGWLRAQGYSAPEIIAEDHERGFLLLEDLGDALFARLIAADPAKEAPLYAAATDFLADLHARAAAPFLAPLDANALSDLVALTPEWYLRGIASGSNPAADALPRIVRQLCADLADETRVTSLRDFHAENLIWLPERAGPARVGLLDFQDAVTAHPAYDLVSLLQDARRDVTAATEQAMIARYVTATGADETPFKSVYALLGAQRALRIIGVFTRLTLHYGKPGYLDYMPRVWRYLDRNLAHPDLVELSEAVRAGLPEPTPERLERIKDQCGQYPTP